MIHDQRQRVIHQKAYQCVCLDQQGLLPADRRYEGRYNLEAAAIDRDESPRVLVDVTNTGHRPGDEVVQLYIRDLG
jgi:hypothetical protein